MIGVIRVLLLGLMVAVFLTGFLILIVTCAGVFHAAGGGAAGGGMAAMIGLVFGGPLVAVSACAFDDWKRGEL